MLFNRLRITSQIEWCELDPQLKITRNKNHARPRSLLPSRRMATEKPLSIVSPYGQITDPNIIFVHIISVISVISLQVWLYGYLWQCQSTVASGSFEQSDFKSQQMNMHESANSSHLRKALSSIPGERISFSLYDFFVATIQALLSVFSAEVPLGTGGWPCITKILIDAFSVEADFGKGLLLKDFRGRRLPMHHCWDPGSNYIWMSRARD
jgi:hypothetical protein